MLTLEQCRRILGPECKLGDADLEELRGQLYGLADIAIEAFIEQRDRDRMNRRRNTQLPKSDGVAQGGNRTEP